MKYLFYIIPTLGILLSFQIHKNTPPDKLISSVGYQKSEINHPKQDTLIKISDPFSINGITCYWELKGIGHDDFYLVNASLELKNYKNKKTILYNEDVYDRTFFDCDFILTFDPRDANFDGFEDFVLETRTGSGSGGSGYRIYFFDDKTSTFIHPPLEIGNIEINNSDKTISGSWKMGAGHFIHRTHYFDGNGKMKFTEIFTNEIISVDTLTLLKRTFQKIINEEIMETKIDTVNFIE